MDQRAKVWEFVGFDPVKRPPSGDGWGDGRSGWGDGSGGGSGKSGGSHNESGNGWGDGLWFDEMTLQPIVQEVTQ